MKRTFLYLAMIALLTGCGVKPSNVEPPSGGETSEFPRTYPEN